MSQDKPQHHHFYCLPFLNMGNVPEIDLGFVKIWNFNIKKEEYIKDTPLRDHVEKIIGSYRISYPHGKQNTFDDYGKRHGIGIISINSNTAERPDYKELQDIKDARLLVFISFLSRNNTITMDSNTGHGMASSENYTQIYFSTVVGVEYMTEHAGFAVPSWHGGIEIEKNISIQPRYIPTPQLRIDGLDTNLLNSLLRMRKTKKKAYRKIMSAIEVFYESYYNSPEVSHNARILLQASSFEILLEKGPDDARKALKDFLRQHADYPEDRKFRYKSERRNKKVYETETKKVMWADRFFTLRNHITHGLVPKEKEYLFGTWQRHFDISLYFFIFCLKRTIDITLKTEIFDDDIVWKTWEDELQVGPIKYTGFKYDSYGRRAWEKMMKEMKKTK